MASWEAPSQVPLWVVTATSAVVAEGCQLSISGPPRQRIDLKGHSPAWSKVWGVLHARYAAFPSALALQGPAGTGWWSRTDCDDWPIVSLKGQSGCGDESYAHP